jgi:hypothetical protein
MSDSYQAIYDAVRSQISGGDIGGAIENAVRNENIGHYASMMAETFRGVMSEHERPSVLFKPTLSLDGDKWCALYGKNLAIGLAGFGDSPEQAMRDFDSSWCKVQQPAKEQAQ